MGDLHTSSPNALKTTLTRSLLMRPVFLDVEVGAENRQDALGHGMEHVLDRELIAVFSEDAGLTVEQMLGLARFSPLPGSLLWRAPED